MAQHTQISSHLAAASSRTGLDSLALTDLHCGLVVDGGRAHPFLDLSCHGQEGLLDIGGTLSGRLKERDSKAVSEFLSHSVLHHLLVFHITLVADKEFVDSLGGVAVNFLQPLLDVVERVHICHIVDDTDAMGTTIVGRGDCSESFLAGSIPDLEFHCLAVKLDSPDFEVNADGRDVALCVGIIRKAKQKARFADAGISDEEELEQIVVFTRDS